MNKLDDTSTYLAFGNFIRNGRLNKNLYQEDVAKALGMSQAYYSHSECGRRKVSLPTALNICRHLGLDLNDFLYTVEKKKPSVKRTTPNQ